MSIIETDSVVKFISGPQEDGREDFSHHPDMNAFVGQIGVAQRYVENACGGWKVSFSGGRCWFIPAFRLKAVDLSELSVEEGVSVIFHERLKESYPPGFTREALESCITYIVSTFRGTLLDLYKRQCSINELISPYNESNLRLVLDTIVGASDTVSQRVERRRLLEKFLLKANQDTLALFFSSSSAARREIHHLFSFLPPKKRPVRVLLHGGTFNCFTPRFIMDFTEQDDVQFMPKGTNLRPVNGSRVPQRTCSFCTRVTEKRYSARTGSGWVCFECALKEGLRTCIHPDCLNLGSNFNDNICTKHKHLYVDCVVTRGPVLKRLCVYIGNNMYMRGDLREELGECRDCGSRHKYRNLHYIDQRWICSSCHLGPRGKLHCYSYKPEPEFFDIPGKKSSVQDLFFGLELELEISARIPQRSASGIFHSKAGTDFAYCKQDGSIRHGIEIVTHPASLRFWKAEEAFFEGINDIVKEVGAHADTNTGIHIHVSRKAFASKEHIRRFALFFSALHVRYPKTAKELFGREPNSYCNTIQKRGGKFTYLKEIPENCEKYSQVNTGLFNTVEVRAFSSFVDKEDILRCIEVVHAIFMFTKHEVSLPILTNPKKKFLTWFTTFVRRMGYKNVIKLLDTKNIT